MDIKHENGMVDFVMRTGKVFVKGTTSLAHAQSVVKNGENVEITNKRGSGKEICVDDKYFFPMVKNRPNKSKNVEEA